MGVVGFVFVAASGGGYVDGAVSGRHQGQDNEYSVNRNRQYSWLHIALSGRRSSPVIIATEHLWLWLTNDVVKVSVARTDERGSAVQWSCDPMYVGPVVVKYQWRSDKGRLDHFVARWRVDNAHMVEGYNPYPGSLTLQRGSVVGARRFRIVGGAD